MQFSTDQKHAETLAFLAEVRDYIASWPPHPSSREMVEKIDHYLQDPLHRLVQDRKHARTGATCIPSGRIVMEARVTEDCVTVSIPVRGGIDVPLLLRRLKRGETIPLHPEEARTRPTVTSSWAQGKE